MRYAKPTQERRRILQTVSSEAIYDPVSATRSLSRVIKYFPTIFIYLEILSDVYSSDIKNKRLPKFYS